MIVRAILVGLLPAIAIGAVSWIAWGGRYLTDDQVAELRGTVLLRRFEGIRAQHPQSGQAFFVSIHSHDADGEMLQRFAEAGRQVRPGSQYTRGAGTYVRLDSFKRLDDDTVEIGGQYHTGKKPDWRFATRLRWHWDGWRIAAEESSPIRESEP